MHLKLLRNLSDFTLNYFAVHSFHLAEFETYDWYCSNCEAQVVLALWIRPNHSYRAFYHSTVLTKLSLWRTIRVHWWEEVSVFCLEFGWSDCLTIAGRMTYCDLVFPQIRPPHSDCGTSERLAFAEIFLLSRHLDGHWIRSVTRATESSSCSPTGWILIYFNPYFEPYSSSCQSLNHSNLFKCP